MAKNKGHSETQLGSPRQHPRHTKDHLLRNLSWKGRIALPPRYFLLSVLMILATVSAHLLKSFDFLIRGLFLRRPRLMVVPELRGVGPFGSLPNGTHCSMNL